MTTTPDILTLTEAAAFIGCSEKTIRVMIRAGKVPYYKIGAQYRLRRAVLDDWMTRQEQAAVAVSAHRID